MLDDVVCCVDISWFLCPLSNRVQVDPDAAAQSTFSPSSFVQMYHKMEEGFMWKLPSGSFVETVLYDNLSSSDHECLGHSFVVDIKNKKVQELFDPGDWNAILNKVPAWPAIDSAQVEFMMELMDVSQSVMSCAIPI